MYPFTTAYFPSTEITPSKVSLYVERKRKRDWDTAEFCFWKTESSSRRNRRRATCMAWNAPRIYSAVPREGVAAHRPTLESRQSPRKAENCKENVNIQLHTAFQEICLPAAFLQQSHIQETITQVFWSVKRCVICGLPCLAPCCLLICFHSQVANCPEISRKRRGFSKSARSGGANSSKSVLRDKRLHKTIQSQRSPLPGHSMHIPALHLLFLWSLQSSVQQVAPC